MVAFVCEDPTLGAKLAPEYVRGVQGQGVAASVKHFNLHPQLAGDASELGVLRRLRPRAVIGEV